MTSSRTQKLTAPQRPKTPPKATAVLSKGEATREAIVQAAHDLALRSGLDGFSIADVALAAGMSKSGAFAHFGSREDLQIAVLNHSAHRMMTSVFQPAIKSSRGLARLKAVSKGLLDYVDSYGGNGGCVVLSASFEFDDKPGPVRDWTMQLCARLQSELARTVQMAKDAAELRADIDVQQWAFELTGIYLALHFQSRMQRVKQAHRYADRALQALIERAA
jgi:AcrR family transcriptional regulator